MKAPLKLIVGIGNPGDQYADTRHNAGIWFIEHLARRYGGTFKEERKFFGRVATASDEGQEIRLLIPSTYMNESGKSVGAIAGFFKIPASQILIAHDELDFSIGKIRFKQGGGLAGHKGLRDIASHLGGDRDFNRLRIGVGHPGTSEQVTGHVLGKATSLDRKIIEQCIDEALACMPLALKGEWDQAMNRLHNFEIGSE
ncbi:MAG: aminoacyl-tRNA hydrolase [Gammaproteobacteria bacterium]|jgi:PTH1 family peptidyl-tRNA hydrolase|nr:aminoacyl-tRNA hydrolase [Gammaproteobacteria bacterium]|tara:strand:- start:1597 stop:2193 length:597 start_codon:yes stop_codon:yes gene_type:complete